MTIDDGAVSAEALRSAGIGEVLEPGQPGFDEEVTGFDLSLRHRPAVVVAARSAAEVATAVTVAARSGSPVAVLGHGHGMLREVDGGVLVTTRHLAAVHVDPVQRTATVAAGATWQQVLDAATPHGLAPLCGSAPHVGVVGYLLGGGLGPLARTFGFAADHVRWMEVVVGDGRLLRADRHENSDLFWALRGGKTGLGIVTAAKLDLFPVRSVFGGGIYYDGADAEAVLRGFAEVSAELPESVSTSVAILRLPPLPELPEMLRGRTVVHVRIAVVGDPADGERLARPFRSLATPLLDAVGELPYAAIGSIHADPVAPMPFVDGGMLLSGFDADAVEALLRIAGPDVPAPLAAVEVRVLGGAVARTPAIPNAVGGREASHSVHLVGAPVPELLDGPVPAAIGAVLSALAPWATGRVQANFVGRANAADGAARWSERVAERLAVVRELYDPAGVFRPSPTHR